MRKTILLTGATDGIGLETAKMLVSSRHTVLLHGRNPAKLAQVTASLSSLTENENIENYVADLSRISDVEALANAVAGSHKTLDVLINNAGIFKTAEPTTPDGLDVRFVVNTLAPYVLTRRLSPLLGISGRIINLSSAAQAPVNLKALSGKAKLADMEAYAQSKLALTAWSRWVGLEKGGPAVIAVNPGSLLGSKMVKQGFGVAGGDLKIGAEILTRAALSEEFSAASGQYFDNDSGRFDSPHPDALDDGKTQKTLEAIETVLAGLTS